MNPWPFIVGAYGISLLGTLALLVHSWSSMRRAEREADRIGPGR